MNYPALVAEICLETTISYQSRDSNLLSNLVLLQNTLGVKLIKSLETYYLASEELISEANVFAVEGGIFAFKPGCDLLLRFDSCLSSSQQRHGYE